MSATSAKLLRQSEPNADQIENVDLRAPPKFSPEVHMMGEIRSGTAFGGGVSCRWRIDHGKHWGLLEGDCFGQTQTAYGPEGVHASWNHPFSLHYQTTSLQGWPKITVQIQQMDSYGRISIIAHGFAHIPFSAGVHNLVISCWRASGTQEEELRGYFLDEHPVLLDEDLVYHKANAFRNRLVTSACGKVHVDLSVITRHFAEYGIDSEPLTD